MYTTEACAALGRVYTVEAWARAQGPWHSCTWRSVLLSPLLEVDVSSSHLRVPSFYSDFKLICKLNLMFSFRSCLTSDKLCLLCFDPAKFSNDQIRFFYDPTPSGTNFVRFPFDLFIFLNKQISLGFDLYNVWGKESSHRFDLSYLWNMQSSLRFDLF